MLSWSHRLKRVSEEHAGLAQSVSSIFNAVFSRLWIDRSLGYLSDNAQPTMLSISLTATLTLTVKPFSLFFFLEYCTFDLFFFFDSDVLLDKQYLKIQHWKKKTNSGDVFSFSLCVSVVCSCSVHVSAKTGWDIVTYLPQLHLTAALHNFQ